MNSKLPPLFNPDDKVDISRWLAIRPKVKQRWLDLLGYPGFDLDGYDRQARWVTCLQTPYGRAEWWKQPTGPEQQQNVILLRPEQSHGKAPGAVVPTYHAETVAGLLLDEERGTLALDPEITEAKEVRCFGKHLVEQGYAVACVEAFPFNAISKPENLEGFGWWQLAAEKILRDNPAWSGMGKLVHDTSRALDLLLDKVQIDSQRIVIMGHSLGGKRAFYTGAMDERFQAVIASDFGLPWQSTNWHELWYLGSRLPAEDSGMAHHELLALLAPRPFYLIAGQTDNQQSWHYLDAARSVYELYGPEKAKLLDGVNHATGHAPTPESLQAAYQWLDKVLQNRP